MHQLREQRLSGVHRRTLPRKGSGKPPPTSNRHHPKSSKNRYRSDTSEWFVQKGQNPGRGRIICLCRRGAVGFKLCVSPAVDLDDLTPAQLKKLVERLLGAMAEINRTA